MIEMSLSELAKLVQGKLVGADVEFVGVHTDSRSIQAQRLFIALQGDRFDGHQFIAQARQAGAVAALVNRRIETDLPCVIVDDTLAALARLAAAWRQKLQLPVIAVTGSNGKTTVKEMIASILRQRGDVLATEGNYNNEIGVPLTLLRLSPTHQYAVIEMGANHPGEIAKLTAIAKPQVAMITNAAAAHLEGFGSVEGVAHAKGEIFSGLEANATVSTAAIINRDDAMADYWRSLVAGHACIEFGLNIDAQVTMAPGSYAMGKTVTSQGLAVATKFEMRTPQGSCEIKIGLLGQHNVINALAAASATLAVGVDLSDIQAGLAQMQAVAGRLQPWLGKRGCIVIDDTYNANPDSLRAALQVLQDLPGQTWLVLGDMGELGPQTEQLHSQMGMLAKQHGIARLWTLGKHSALSAEQFGEQARAFQSVDELVTDLSEALSADCVVLVKGSRFMRMEQVVQCIRMH